MNYVLHTETHSISSRQEKISLLVSLNASSCAEGQLYWDDGDSLDSVDMGRFSHITFLAAGQRVVSHVTQAGYTPANGLTLGQFTVLGVMTSPNEVKVNNERVGFLYVKQSKVRRHSVID